MIIHGEAVASMQAMPEGSVDSIVTDPPYGLEFMGKEWDHGIPARLTWEACCRVLKPGGYMLAMGGTRTFHRLACAIEDAGFEMRDTLAWLYGSGFPKGKGCLKPAWEPILLCRKPGAKVLPLGIDGCRIPTDEKYSYNADRNGSTFHGEQGERLRYSAEKAGKPTIDSNPAGRWPANVVHDGSDEVMEAFAEFGELTSGKASANGHKRNAGTTGPIYGGGNGLFPAAGDAGELYGDSGSAARFFYCAKASRRERGEGNSHPTVKPLALMRWMVRLVTPKGGTVLDPFGGSGTTALAAQKEGRECITIEREESYVSIIRSRLAECELPMMRTGA